MLFDVDSYTTSISTGSADGLRRDTIGQPGRRTGVDIVGFVLTHAASRRAGHDCDPCRKPSANPIFEVETGCTSESRLECFWET